MALFESKVMARANSIINDKELVDFCRAELAALRKENERLREALDMAKRFMCEKCRSMECDYEECHQLKLIEQALKQGE